MRHPYTKNNNKKQPPWMEMMVRWIKQQHDGKKYHFPSPITQLAESEAAVFKDALLWCQLAACPAVLVFTKKTARTLRSDLPDADTPLVTCFSSLKMNTGPATGTCMHRRHHSIQFQWREQKKKKFHFLRLIQENSLFCLAWLGPLKPAECLNEFKHLTNFS